ncbi:MAG: hypothetical protein IKW76_09210 [Clostridia bacterium]|nr:hypothetical protein [Clostridia bacterium]
MKKTYEKPEMQTEMFDVEDVITVSGTGTVPTVGDGMEVLLGALANMLGGN